MNEPFNERLTDIMSEKNMTAQTLGESIGLSDSIIYRWLRGNSSIRSENLIKLSMLFDYSMDFICGRTDNPGKYISVQNMDFSERIKEIVLNSGKSLNSISKEIKTSRSRFHGWYKGVSPKSASLITLADYFEVTIDYLLGRE